MLRLHELDDGWQVCEKPESLARRTQRHLTTHGRTVTWFTDEQNRIWDRFVVACIMAPGYVLKGLLGADTLRKEENAISVEFGGWDSDPSRWRWFMGDQELCFTLGHHGRGSENDGN